MVDVVEELDRHFLTFSAVGPPVWVVQKSEGRLTDEHLARLGVDVNRSDDRATTSPAPLVPVCQCGWPVPAKMAAVDRRRRRAAQMDLFPEPDVDVDGRKRKG